MIIEAKITGMMAKQQQKEQPSDFVKKVLIVKVMARSAVATPAVVITLGSYFTVAPATP